MKITNKPALLGKKFNVHNVRSLSEEGENDGDAGEFVSARDIPLKSITLTKKQFNELVGVKDFDHVCFDYSEGERRPKAIDGSNLSKLNIDAVFKNCSASIEFGLSKNVIEVEDAKIKNISIKLKGVSGVWGEMSCTLQAVLPRDLKTLELEDHFGKPVNVTLQFGQIEAEESDAQGALDLQTANEADDEDDDQPVTRTRRNGSQENRLNAKGSEE